MKHLTLFVLSLIATVFFSACEKETGAAGRDAVVRVTVLDEEGKPLAGVPVKLYDEKGYEAFEKDNLTPPVATLSTDAQGCAAFRLPFPEWFVSGDRKLTFVIQEGGGSDNYRIWTKSRTVGAGGNPGIEFRLKPGGEPARELDMFDENHGRTLFGGNIYIDAARNFVGDAPRYSFAGAGTVFGLDDMEEPRLDALAGEIAVQPGDGYYIYKDVSLMEFRSGKRALSQGAEYVRLYVSRWLSLGEEIVGARIRYDVLRAEGRGLPEWERVFDVKLAEGNSVAIPLGDKNGDYEFEKLGDPSVEFVREADRVLVRILNTGAGVGTEYRICIRNGLYYTLVVLRLV